jgi:hypothetical protein
MPSAKGYWRASDVLLDEHRQRDEPDRRDSGDGGARARPGGSRGSRAGGRCALDLVRVHAPAGDGAFRAHGDLDANPELLGRLEALATQRGEQFTITSGNRTYAEQERLWNGRGSNPFPVARPGSSRHESGNAADVTIGGRPIQDVIGAAELTAAGVSPLAGDAVHVELPG